MRFTIAKHSGSPEGDHFDLLLESGEALRTWRFQAAHFDTPQPAKQLKDHRKKYLDYQGEISGGRGRVAVHETGEYAVDVWSDKVVQIAVTGGKLKTRLRLDLQEGEDWILVDATAELRRLVSSHLRNAELDAAPNEELSGLREALATEEQKLLSFVGRYAKAGTVDWSTIEMPTPLKDRIQSEWVRWRHPWLDQAKAFVDRLNGLVTALHEAKPPVAAGAR
jgi:hypothetical protein